MKKPEMLKGEVKEFIIVSKWKNDNNTEILRDFYSQPFQPEMITEYFEADEFELDSTMINLFSKAFRIGENPFYLIGKGQNDLYEDTFGFKPKTLSQFITNCIQANIKLTWR